MKKIIQFLLPKENKFFEMLAEQSEVTFEAVKELKDFVDGYSKFERSERKVRIQLIRNLEQKVDELTHNIAQESDRSFITPMYKGYIQKIALIIEEISDIINSIASRFVILSIEHVDDYIIRLVDTTYNIVNETNKSIKKLKKLKDAKEHCNKIYNIEKEADGIYEKALSDLFHYHKSPIDIIKYKEIYEFLEDVVNKCRDIAKIIESVIAKHA